MDLGLSRPSSINLEAERLMLCGSSTMKVVVPAEPSTFKLEEGTVSVLRVEHERLRPSIPKRSHPFHYRRSTVGKKKRH